jgi:hypothetical protein
MPFFSLQPNGGINYFLVKGDHSRCVFVFSMWEVLSSVFFLPSAFIYGVHPKFPFVIVSSFLGLHFEFSLEVPVTTSNKGYEHTNR